jgi:uncharacterized protein
MPGAPKHTDTPFVRRLDAIGAIGLARCFTYGGAHRRTLHDPEQLPRQLTSEAQYAEASAKPTSVNHVYEKLLRLQVQRRLT